MILKGRQIVPGKAKDIALVSDKPISFYGGVDPETGIVLEKGHPLEGKSVANKILVFPNGKGSTVGSYTLYRLKKNGKAPKALVLRECEAIVAVGAILAEIPCVDRIKIHKIKDGSIVEVNADEGTVKV